MARKQLNVSVPETDVIKVDEKVKASSGVFSNRSHWVQLAIKEKLERDATTAKKR